MHRNLAILAAALLAAGAMGGSARAQKSGGVLKISFFDNPASMSLHEEATGAGETSITLIAAALGNAIFDATGARLRQIPFTPERVKAAIGARA